jgi:hypothetical protein
MRRKTHVTPKTSWRAQESAQQGVDSNQFGISEFDFESNSEYRTTFIQIDAHDVYNH